MNDQQPAFELPDPDAARERPDEDTLRRPIGGAPKLLKALIARGLRQEAWAAAAVLAELLDEPQGTPRA
jgi:hypothetical protein